MSQLFRVRRIFPGSSSALKKKSGFTLMELMITIAIVSIIGAGIMTYFTQAFNAWIRIRNSAEITNVARIAVLEMAVFIRQAVNPGSSLFFQPAVGESLDHISFVCLQDDGANNKTIAYEKTDSALYRIVDGIRTPVIQSGVANISFVHTSTYVVTISSFTVTKGDTEIVLNRTIYLRNP